MDNRAYKAQLKAVRRYTGEAFAPARGYSAAKKPNFGQRMAVLRYFNKLEELTARPTVTYKPKRGEKTEVFTYTNQKGWKKFNTAIIPQFNPEAKLEFHFNKSRPKGSRFYTVDKRPQSKQRMYIIPAHLFLEFDESGDDESDVSKYEDILNEYSDGSEFFLIQNGTSFIQGAPGALAPSAGSAAAVARKIKSLQHNYSSQYFDPNNRNSHHIDNWFKGVYAFTRRYDAFPLLERARRERNEYLDDHGLKRDHDRLKMRFIKNTATHAVYAIYYDGVFQRYEHIKHKD